MLVAADTASFRPAFGPGSRVEHRSWGAVEIDLEDLDRLRRDVDTPDDLAAALRMGIGPRSSRVTADLF